MFLTTWQMIVTILAVALGAQVTRTLPFLLFANKETDSPLLVYLGKYLPAAMMGLLVVYCLKDVSFISVPYAIPEFVSIAVIIALHLWKRNVLLSICVGTALYMFMIQML